MINIKFNKLEIITLAVLLSACSILYELVLANVLSVITGNQVLWQSLTIAIFIGGLGYGAFLAEKIKAKLTTLITLELILSVLGAISLFVVYSLYGTINLNKYLLFISAGYDGREVINTEFGLELSYLALTQIITFTIGLCTGLELPLLLKMNEEENIGLSEGEILGANYFGTLIGTISFSFYLKPTFDLLGSAIIVASVNYLIMYYLLTKKSRSNLFKGLAVFGLAFFVMLYSYSGSFLNVFLKFHYYLPRFTFKERVEKELIVSKIMQQKNIEREKSLYQYLDMVHFSDDDYTFSLDQHFQFNSKNEHFYHQAFAHVPLIFANNAPRNVLVLGAGDGLLIRELVRYQKIERIVNVELDGLVIKRAKEDPRFLKLNKGSYFDQRVSVEVGDGFYYVRNSKEMFDAVYVDFPYPNNFDLARLYSVEIYKFIANRLNPGGFMILDAPMEQLDKNNVAQTVMETPFTENDRLSNSILLSTIAAAGFKTLFPFEVNGETFILAGKDEIDLTIDFDSAFNKTLFSDDVFLKVQKIKSQNFPYDIKKEYINSVFSPKLGLKRL